MGSHQISLDHEQHNGDHGNIGQQAGGKTNKGQDEHNLNVVPGEGPVAGAFANTPSKGISDQQVILRAGSYTLFCSLPEHKQKGMKATLLVE